MSRLSGESREPRKIAFFSNCPEKLSAKKRKCRPSGRNTGQRWLDSERDESSLVISTGSPPEADKRNIPLNTLGEKRIVPSAFQAPPRPLGASASTSTNPPERSAFLSFPFAKNPMDRPSDDQKGWVAPSVPGTAVCPRLPTSCVQRTYLFAWS